MRPDFLGCALFCGQPDHMARRIRKRRNREIPQVPGVRTVMLDAHSGVMRHWIVRAFGGGQLQHHAAGGLGAEGVEDTCDGGKSGFIGIDHDRLDLRDAAAAGAGQANTATRADAARPFGGPSAVMFKDVEDQASGCDIQRADRINWAVKRGVSLGPDRLTGLRQIGPLRRVQSRVRQGQAEVNCIRREMGQILCLRGDAEK